MDDEQDQIYRGVGSVCVAAASLEWSLAYCSSLGRRPGGLPVALRVFSASP
jgi:hypothetical protein